MLNPIVSPEPGTAHAQITPGTPGGCAGRQPAQPSRQSLSSLGMWVVPGYLGVANAASAFDEAGQLQDPVLVKLLETLARQFVARLGSGV